MTRQNGPALRRSLLAAYAAPAFAFAMPTLPVYLYLPTLYNQITGLSLAVIGTVLLLARLFDTFSDPVIGYLSDHSASLWGRRKPWLLMGAPFAALGLVMVVDPPASAGAGHLLFWMLVLYTGWTSVTVPYLAWAAEITADYNQRTRVTAAREGLALSGILFAAAVPAGLVNLGVDQNYSLIAVSWSAIAIGVVGLIVLAAFVPDPPADPERDIRRHTLRTVWSVWSNKPFVQLACAWFVNGLSNGVGAVLFLLYLEHGLGANEAIRPWFILAYFVCAIVAIPFWTAACRRIDKHQVWCLAMVTAIAGFAFVPFIEPGCFWAFFVVCAITGATLGADLTIPPSLQADVVDFDIFKHRADRAGLFFSLWSMTTKLALGASVGGALLAVAWAGFDPAEPTSQGRYALIVIYSVAPLVFKSMAVALVWHHPITRRRHKAIQWVLKGRESTHSGD